MTDHKHPESGAKTEEDEAFFIARVVWIMNKSCTFIEKDRLCLFK